MDFPRGRGGRSRGLTLWLLVLIALAWGCDSGGGGAAAPAPLRSVDLATIPPGAAGVLRVHGSEGVGSAGVPVTGGHDVDGDGNADVAMAAFQADPNGRTNAGEVFLHLGDGTIGGIVDTAVASARILRIQGAAEAETTGSEIWMDDVTGDGAAELIIARQNFTPDPGRIGAGAVTLLIGGPGVATQAASLAPIDLAVAPPAGITLTTLVGGEALGRFGIWIRTGDVTGDGIADLLVGADQEDSGGEPDSGAVYLIRGGPHLAVGGTVDLVDLATALPGHLAQIRAPTGAAGFHVGATCALADLDGNGRAEVIAAATIERAGASFPALGAPAGSAVASGGVRDGAIYIAWDDNFAGAWPAGFSFAFDTAPDDTSEVRGGVRNIAFGEEILGGLDFDADGNADLFLGDIVGDATGGFRLRSGSGHLLYDAASLRGAPAFDLDNPPPGLVMTTFIGPERFDIASDTGLQGDFDDDGFPDLAFSSPHGSPYGRSEAGKIHVIHGQVGPWPAVIDLRWGRQPDPMDVRISEVHGVKAVDVLCYSADAADYDGDGVDDLIVNEMLGDGLLPADANTGNVLVLSGTLIRDLP
ncbi:MAG: integrin alpha [bacterium]|nr:integrin alpha [bacterium]